MLQLKALQVARRRFTITGHVNVEITRLHARASLQSLRTGAHRFRFARQPNPQQEIAGASNATTNAAKSRIRTRSG
jgi:hypothetical protein